MGIGGLFVSPLAATTSLLFGASGVGAAGRLWDDTPAGHEGAVARAARSVAGTSVSVPVVVIIDDVDRLEPDLAVALIENLVGRHDGHVLVIATAEPSSELIGTLVNLMRTD